MSESDEAGILPPHLDPTPELAVLAWPSSFGIVPPGKMAEVGLAVALLALRDQGLISMEVATKKVLMVRRTHVVVARTGAGVGAEGVGGQLLKVLMKPESVSDLVYRWFGDDVSSPAGQVVWAFESVACDRGYYRVVTREGGLISRHFKAKHVMEPIPERLAMIQGHADALGARWQAFAQQEPALHKELMTDVERGMKRRVEVPDSPD